MSEEKIADALREIAASNWQRSPPTPTYLSSLPKVLREKVGEDYRDALKGETLKQFVKRTESQRQYKLITHPSLPAKLAIVPFDANYSFSGVLPEPDAPKLSSADVASFAKVLQSLPLATLAQWSIPAELVLKLISHK